MIPPTFGTSPELLLEIFETRNTEDVARAQRARAARTLRAAHREGPRWVRALRGWAPQSRRLPAADPATHRLA